MFKKDRDTRFTRDDDVFETNTSDKSINCIKIIRKLYKNYKEKDLFIDLISLILGCAKIRSR